MVDKRLVLVQNSAMKQAKAMTVRLSEEQAQALEMVASVENRPVSDIIRAAITTHIETRRRDPSFQAGLKDRISQARKLLDR
ncbi:ribbon-helix-helix protein, CopG family [Mesorhizobium sp. M1312]|uniref:Putative transcriptional regulator n=1 Tax=Mesorhizobium sangaii TaxID=505389 RepID=A0A841PN52_9HYPH|nr:putative transcriptional regulator [Mesorhizobium sangaii]